MIKSVQVKDSGARWYVEYREYDPQSKLWLRRREYDRKVNSENNPEEKRRKIQLQYDEIILSLGKSVKRQDTTIKGYINSYIDDKKTSLAKTSIKNIKLALKYLYTFLKFHGYHELSLDEITREHIHAFRKGLSKVTGNRY